MAPDRTGTKLYDKVLPNDEAKMRAVINQLAAHGTVLFVVDQPATIGALPVAVAQAAGITVGYLPGLAMLCGFDDDLAKQLTATSNRLRDLLTQIHPGLERVLDPR